MRELRERAGPVLKTTCLILAVLAVYQLAGVFIRWNPFRGVIVPAIPSLATSTNGPAGGARGTSLAVAATGRGTNNTTRSAGTNVVASATSANTNSTLQKPSEGNGTNPIAHVESEMIITNAATNVVAHLETNSASSTNPAVQGSNVMVSTNAAGTNAVMRPQPNKMIANNAPPGKRGADLPPAMQARISRITDSEILGPVMHPLPMALMGIAGEFAFLRSASGETGLVKEGDSLGDIKLLRIGINRVLIEQAGQKKELTIFSGYGGDSLLPAQKDTPDENNQQ